MARLRRWPLLTGGEAPDTMVFRVDPPAEIGDVLGAWTNVGPRGPSPRPLSLVGLGVGGGAMTGLVVGLVGFFVVAGILEHQGGPGASPSADAFLASVALGTLAGAAISAVLAMRPTQALALFVGTEGNAQIEREGSDAKTHLLLYRDVASMRTHVSVMVHQGIRTALREVHVRRHDGRESLWMVSAAPGEQKPDDPQYAFAEATLRGFQQFQARAASSA